MSRRKIGRYVFVSILSFFIIFSPVNFSFFLNSSSAQTVPDETISGAVVWSENRVVTGTVTVQSGATLSIKKGVMIEFDGKAQINVNGNLSIEGTPTQPVVLKKKDADEGDLFAITAVSSGVISARNAEVSGGGNASQVFMTEGNQSDFLFQRANAYWMYIGAFGARGGGTLDIEGVNFHDNALAVYADSSSFNRIKVWRSKFSTNNLDLVNSNGTTVSDIRYNWWGNADGPEHCVDLNECDYFQVYKKIIGKVNIIDWAKEEHFKDPVIVVPGIMGSWKMTQKSTLELDPILGTYDGLLETLDENGYTSGENLFPFPYEWHLSNIGSAKLLRTKIDEIKAQTKWPKVDIVAHSMGGLVAREYIGTLNGGSSVDQLITLGTPHDGAPKGYLMWEGGEFASPSRFNLFDSIANKIFQQEAEENGYASTFEYIRKAPIASVRELLPAYAYLRDRGSGELRIYPNLYPVNTFLQNLKTVANISRLAPVAFTNIVGRTNDNDTIEKIRVDGASIELLNNPEAIVLWGHGEPDGYDDLFGGDRGLELGAGDGTVPIDSAKSIIADETIEIEGSHSDLPSVAAKRVFKTLTGVDVLPDVLLTSPLTSVLLFMLFSPIDVQIVSPSGLRVGKNFETGGVMNEIEGAYYTGYDTPNEFVTIPNPEKGEYQVLTQGTGTGDYRVEAVNIQEDADGKAKESIATITGTAEMGKEVESTVEVKESGAVILVGGTDVVPPTTIATLSGTAGTNSWYVGDVSVTLTAQDEENGSGVEKIEYSLDNGANWNIYADPVVISQEGITSMLYASTDKEGNKEEAKTVSTKIDKTAPEGKVVFNPITRKLDIIGTDNLSQNVSALVIEQQDMNISSPKVKKIKPWFSHWFQKNKKRLPSMLATITDEAGHTTSIAFEKTKDRDSRLFLGIKSIAYDDNEVVLSNAAVQYKWQINKKNQYQLFATHLMTILADIESHYIPKKNETWIMEKPRDLADDDKDDESERRAVQTKLPGMVIPYLQTDKGSVKIGY